MKNFIIPFLVATFTVPVSAQETKKVFNTRFELRAHVGDNIEILDPQIGGTVTMPFSVGESWSCIVNTIKLSDDGKYKYAGFQCSVRGTQARFMMNAVCALHAPDIDNKYTGISSGTGVSLGLEASCLTTERVSLSTYETR